jgi:7-cyano-7-deazaguanine reductase
VPDKEQFTALGHTGSPDLGGRLEVFDCPPSVTYVSMTSDEVTAICPVTSQPDLYVVVISYNPGSSCIESKSLKLYLNGFRNKGIFCEELAELIAYDVYNATRAPQVQVQVTQKSRGGISVHASADLDQGRITRPLWNPPE